MTRTVQALLLLITLFSRFTANAGTLKGKITDEHGEPLPFATVYIKGTSVGTAANANAEYVLQLPNGTHNIICQYMGFAQVKIPVSIKDGETVTRNFSLKEQKLKMDAIVVKADAEDPAYAIIRKAIKKRKYHKKQIESFQTSLYLKGVVRNRDMPDKIFGIDISGADMSDVGGGGADSNSLGILYLCEQEADYYVKGKKKRTVIKSVRESGTANGVGLAQVPPIVSFYNNNVSPLYGVGKRGFISPISDGALGYYRYKFQGSFVQDGYMVNKIKITPRRKYEPLFQGDIYIVDKDWAIHSLSLLLTKKSNLEQLDTLRVEQTYLSVGKDIWVIKSQVQYPTLTFFGLGFTGNFVTVYEEQKVNADIPDSLFNSKVISSYTSDANDKDSLYWVNKRPVPLEADEKEDYHKKDSLTAIFQDPKYKDSIRRKRNKFKPMDLFMGGYYYTGKGYKSTFQTNSILGGMLTYNTVEGIVVNPKIKTTNKIDSSRYLYSSIGVRYGFGNTHLNAFGRFSYKKYDRSWIGRSFEAGIEGGKYIYQYNPNSTVSQLFNTYSTLLYGKNLMKMYESWTGAAFINRKYGNGLSWSLKGGFQRRLPLKNTSFYTWADNNPEKWTSNFPDNLKGSVWEQHNAVLLKAVVSYQPGSKYIQYPKFKSRVRSSWPVFTLKYEKGVPNVLDSKVDFDKWQFNITDYLNLKMLGGLQYNIGVGGFLNSNYVSLPDMMHIADNELLFASPYVEGFQLAPYFLYSNTSRLYGKGHVEYNMNGLLTNKLPLLRQARWNLVAGANGLHTGNGNYYVEAFVGIDNLGYKIFRFLRVDLVRSWDNTGRMNTGIRIGLDMGAVPGVSIEDDSDNFEW